MKSHRLIRRRIRLAVRILPLVAAIGCSSPDERYVELAKDSTRRQAEQNQQIAQQSQTVADAAHQIVEADGQARREFIQAQGELQKEIHVERQSLDHQHESLADERREIAGERQRDPVIANAIVSAATLLACALPILLCFFVVRTLNRDTTDDLIGELLVSEFVRGNSVLLPAETASVEEISVVPSITDKIFLGASNEAGHGQG